MTWLAKNVCLDPLLNKLPSSPYAKSISKATSCFPLKEKVNYKNKVTNYKRLYPYRTLDFSNIWFLVGCTIQVSKIKDEKVNVTASFWVFLITYINQQGGSLSFEFYYKALSLPSKRATPVLILAQQGKFSTHEFF